MNLTIKDRANMKYMGYKYRAWFVNPHGVPFHKDFPTAEKMDAFINQAREVGTRLSGFVSL